MTNDCWHEIGVWGDCSCPQLQPYIHCHNCPVYSTAGRQLLEREALAGYLNEQTHLLTQQKEEQVVGTVSVGIFRLGAEWLALPASVFQEVTELSPIHTLPHRTNKILLGLVNIRGEIQICVSLKELLGLDTLLENQASSSIIYRRMVVAKKDDSLWVFPVDEIFGVHRINPDDFQNVPATISKATGTYTKAIIHWQDKAVNYLDEELLFYTLNRKVLEQF